MAGLGSPVALAGMASPHSASIILIQEIVDWSERGSVTASYLCSQSREHVRSDCVRLCSISILRSGHAGATSEQLRQLLSKARKRWGEPGLRAALEQSLHLTFVSMFGVALMVAATLFLVPKVVFALGKRSPSERNHAAAFARFSPTATASVIARAERRRQRTERAEVALDDLEPHIGEAGERRQRALSVTTTIDAGAARVWRGRR